MVLCTICKDAIVSYIFYNIINTCVWTALMNKIKIVQRQNK